ncbi:MAG: YkgJ family cysteine cluster protein [Spirochaetia bacterium]
MRFGCDRCSNCCRHSPGFVFLIQKDIERLTYATGLDRGTFLERYCREVNISGFHRVSLIEKANCDCVFWEQDGCTVYRHRPMQCRSYPFWSGNLFSQRAWERLRSSCPGVGQGRLHSQREIQRWLRLAEANRFIATFAEIE